MVRITQGMRSSFALENPMVLFNKTHAWAVSLHFTASGFTHAAVIHLDVQSQSCCRESGPRRSGS